MEMPEAIKMIYQGGSAEVIPVYRRNLSHRIGGRSTEYRKSDPEKTL